MEPLLICSTTRVNGINRFHCDLFHHVEATAVRTLNNPYKAPKHYKITQWINHKRQHINKATVSIERVHRTTKSRPCTSLVHYHSHDQPSLHTQASQTRTHNQAKAETRNEVLLTVENCSQVHTKVGITQTTPRDLRISCLRNHTTRSHKDLIQMQEKSQINQTLLVTLLVPTRYCYCSTVLTSLQRGRSCPCPSPSPVAADR